MKNVLCLLVLVALAWISLSVTATTTTTSKERERKVKHKGRRYKKIQNRKKKYMETGVTRLGDFFCFLGNHSKPEGTMILHKLPTLLGNFCKGVKIIILVKSFLGNFCRDLAIFYWSHWWRHWFMPTEDTPASIIILTTIIGWRVFGMREKGTSGKSFTLFHTQLNSSNSVHSIVI